MIKLKDRNQLENDAKVYRLLFLIVCFACFMFATLGLFNWVFFFPSILCAIFAVGIKVEEIGAIVRLS